MSLSGKIDERLWSSVRSAYEAGNYSAAILDSIFYLSELLRNKSGLESDGNALVGAALGGQNPIIKVNSLHTETDRDEQRGVEQLLRGIYTALRNPRSHEKRTDTCETADVLIAFVGWISGLVDKSKSPFDLQQIANSVFDEHFAHNTRYAELLVDRIPKRKRLDALVDIFQRREDGNWKSISLFMEAVLKSITPDEQEEFWRVASEALETATSDGEYRSAIQILENHWESLSEFARIRAEHRLIRSIREGEYNAATNECLDGALGSWARDIGARFVLKEELKQALLGRLYSDKPEARAYLFQYFFYVLMSLMPTPQSGVVRSLTKRLKEHDKVVYDALSWVSLGAFDDGTDPWVDAFRGAIKDFDGSQITEITDDDIPF